MPGKCGACALPDVPRQHELLRPEDDLLAFVIDDDRPLAGGRLEDDLAHPELAQPGTERYAACDPGRGQVFVGDPKSEAGKRTASGTRAT